MPTPSPTPDLASPLSGLTGLLISLVFALLALLLLLLLIRGATAIAMRRGRLTTAEADTLRESLLNAVFAATYQPGVRVTLGGFWRGQGLRAADKWQVLRPSLRSKELLVGWSNDSWVSTFQAIAQNVFSRPPRTVIMSQRLREQMAHQPSVEIHNRDGVVQVGENLRAKVRTSSRNDISPEFVAMLVAALRLDATKMPPADAEQAHSLADSLESDAAGSRWNAVSGTIDRLLSIAASGASVWASTLAILGSLK